MHFTRNATIQPSLIDIILFSNFLLKFANRPPSRIKPGRTHWHPELETLLWSPTQLNSCIAIHLRETWNSPDLIACFSFGQPSNRWASMTPAVFSLHSAKTGKVRQVRRQQQPAVVSRRTACEDSQLRAVQSRQGSLLQVAVIGFSSCFPALPPAGGKVCRWLTVLPWLTPREPQCPYINWRERGNTNSNESFIWSHQLTCKAREVKYLCPFFFFRGFLTGW